MKNYSLDSQYIADKGTLIVGVTDFKPLDYQQDGKWIGFDAEMAEAFSKKLGVDIKFVEIEWNKKIELLENGDIDCIWNGMTLSDEVLANMECSRPYLNNAQIIVLPKKEADNFKTADECRHLLFAVESGSVGEQELKSRNYRYTSVEFQKDALKSVISGGADAAVIDSIMAGVLVGDGKEYQELVYTYSLNNEEYGVGFRKGSDLAEKLNAFFGEVYKNGDFMAMAKKYAVQAAVIALE